MIIDCIGCLHGYCPRLDGGDVLIITGDITASDSLRQYIEFNLWLSEQDYRMKIIIGGNHDKMLETGFEVVVDKDFTAKMKPIMADKTVYLEDSGIEFDGIKLWGTPRSLIFPEINPVCMAFAGQEKDLEEHYKNIPQDIDVLISHTPFFGVLDKNKKSMQCGSVALRNTVDRVKPKYFVCSHIHEQGGSLLIHKNDDCNTVCVNCSIMNESYQPSNEPMRITL